MSELKACKEPVLPQVKKLLKSNGEIKDKEMKSTLISLLAKNFMLTDQNNLLGKLVFSEIHTSLVDKVKVHFKKNFGDNILFDAYYDVINRDIEFKIYKKKEDGKLEETFLSIYEHTPPEFGDNKLKPINIIYRPFKNEFASEDERKRYYANFIAPINPSRFKNVKFDNYIKIINDLGAKNLKIDSSLKEFQEGIYWIDERMNYDLKKKLQEVFKDQSSMDEYIKSLKKKFSQTEEGSIIESFEVYVKEIKMGKPFIPKTSFPYLDKLNVLDCENKVNTFTETREVKVDSDNLKAEERANKEVMATQKLKGKNIYYLTKRNYVNYEAFEFAYLRAFRLSEIINSRYRSEKLHEKLNITKTNFHEWYKAIEEFKSGIFSFISLFVFLSTNSSKMLCVSEEYQKRTQNSIFAYGQKQTTNFTYKSEKGKPKLTKSDEKSIKTTKFKFSPIYNKETAESKESYVTFYKTYFNELIDKVIKDNIAPSKLEIGEPKFNGVNIYTLMDFVKAEITEVIKNDSGVDINNDIENAYLIGPVTNTNPEALESFEKLTKYKTSDEEVEEIIKEFDGELEDEVEFPYLSEESKSFSLSKNSFTEIDPTNSYVSRATVNGVESPVHSKSADTIKVFPTIGKKERKNRESITSYADEVEEVSEDGVSSYFELSPRNGRGNKGKKTDKQVIPIILGDSEELQNNLHHLIAPAIAKHRANINDKLINIFTGLKEEAKKKTDGKKKSGKGNFYSNVKESKLTEEQTEILNEKKTVEELSSKEKEILFPKYKKFAIDNETYNKIINYLIVLGKFYKDLLSEYRYSLIAVERDYSFLNLNKMDKDTINVFFLESNASDVQLIKQSQLINEIIEYLDDTTEESDLKNEALERSGEFKIKNPMSSVDSDSETESEDKGKSGRKGKGKGRREKYLKYKTKYLLLKEQLQKIGVLI